VGGPGVLLGLFEYPLDAVGLYRRGAAVDDAVELFHTPTSVLAGKAVSASPSRWEDRPKGYGGAVRGPPVTATDAADAFSLLADATRLSILEALVVANREDPTSATLSFSELYERSGIEDTGRFNYHLDKLVGRFVEKSEGYRLSPAGIRVAGAVFSGYYDSPTDVEDEPLGPCPACDGTLSVSYESGLFSVSCEGGHAFGDLVPPRVFEDRDAAAAAEAMAVAVVGRARQAQRGACPQCFGHVEWSMVEPPPDDTAPGPVALSWQCRTCGVPYAAPPGMFVPWDPAVEAALREHGVDVWEEPVRWLALGEEWTVTAFDADAGRASVEATLSGVPVTATVGERGEVLEFRVGG